jgi:hypothetical protein
MENRRLSWGDGRHREFALLRLGSREVSIVSSRDFQHSTVIYIIMDLRSFRVQIASGSLELQAQQDAILLAESYGCLWLAHFFLDRNLEDRVVTYYLAYSAARVFLFSLLIYIVALEKQSSMQIVRSSVLKLASISKNWAGLRLILTAIKIQQRSRRSKIWLVHGWSQ